MSSPALTRPAAGGAAAVKVPAFGLLDVLNALGVLAMLYAAFAIAPAERVQGDVFRILYVHVPMAWLAYLAFFVVLVGSVGYLWRRSRRLDDVARASAELGVVLTALTLVTGSIYARPVWGIWWTWDARLTTTLVLFFIYVGYLMVRSAIDDPDRAARIAAVIGVFGFVGVLVNYFSVSLWRTLHPEPTVTRSSGMTAEMAIALVVAVVGFTLVYARLMTRRVGLIRAQERLSALAQWVSDRMEAR